MYQFKSLTIRTDNSPRGIEAIAALWRDILGGNLPVTFKGHDGIFPIAHYHNYESNHLGAYDYTVMQADKPFIVNLEQAVREGKYKKYEASDAGGDITAATQCVWHQVWADNSISRAFTHDYEMSMSPDFTPDHSAYCRLYISI